MAELPACELLEMLLCEAIFSETGASVGETAVLVDSGMLEKVGVAVGCAAGDGTGEATRSVAGCTEGVGVLVGGTCVLETGALVG